MEQSLGLSVTGLLYRLIKVSFSFFLFFLSTSVGECLDGWAHRRRPTRIHRIGKRCRKVHGYPTSAMLIVYRSEQQAVVHAHTENSSAPKCSRVEVSCRVATGSECAWATVGSTATGIEQPIGQLVHLTQTAVCQRVALSPAPHTPYRKVKLPGSRAKHSSWNS